MEEILLKYLLFLDLSIVEKGKFSLAVFFIEIGGAMNSHLFLFGRFLLIQLDLMVFAVNCVSSAAVEL